MPDNFGKPIVASVEKDAFPKDTAILCSKRLFAKLADENKLATVIFFLSDATPFSSDESKYMKEYIKKNASMVFEVLIETENIDAIKSCLEQMNYAESVLDEAMRTADCLNRIDMKAFLLECKNNATEE